MNRTRRIGLVVAAVATLVWSLFLVALLTGDPADGANIGAGLAALLALPLSVGASITLLLSLSLRSRRPDAGGAATPRRASERIGAALAVVSVAGLLAFLVLDPYTDSDVLRTASLAGGVGAFLLSSAAFALPPRSRA